MCLALPARLIARVDEDEAIVELGGVRKQISVALVPEARVDDYVIVHVGHAIGLIDPVEAERTLALFAELDSEASGAGAGTNANATATANANAETSSTNTDTRTFPAPVNDPRSRETDPRP